MSEDLQLIEKTQNNTSNQNKVTLLLVINNPIIYNFFKEFTNYRKKNNRAVFLAVDLSPTFLNTGATNTPSDTY